MRQINSVASKIVHPSHADHSRARAAVVNSQKYSTSWIQHIQFHDESMLSSSSRRKHGHRILRTIFSLNQKKNPVNLKIVERIFYRFTMNTARRPANQQGKKMSGFRGRRRAVGPIYNNGYTTQYTRVLHVRMCTQLYTGYSCTY